MYLLKAIVCTLFASLDLGQCAGGAHNPCAFSVLLFASTSAATTIAVETRDPCGTECPALSHLVAASTSSQKSAAWRMPAQNPFFGCGSFHLSLNLINELVHHHLGVQTLVYTF